MDDAEILEVDDDYYAFLNLPRDVRSTWVQSLINFFTGFLTFRNSLLDYTQATLEQINAAYKTLSRVYHPDKHTDPAKKKDAELLFNRVKTAHAVLSNPEDRQIYDLLGTRGLRTDGLQLIPR